MGAEPVSVRDKMTRSERNDSVRRRLNWRWKCKKLHRSKTAEESWTCDVTVGNWVQGLGYVYDLVGNIADGPMANNTQNSTKV